MSYANGTTHYNLPQTVGSDKRDWFDTNEAFRDIDEAIHTAVTDSSTAIDQIGVVETSVTEVDEKADAIGERVTTIEGKQATDEENIAQNAQAISRVESKVDTIGVDLAEMIEVTEEPSATASVQHNVGTYFRYNDNLWITTVLIRVGDEIVPNVNCETTDVMTRVYNLEHSGGGSVSADAVSFDSTGTDIGASNVEDAIKNVRNKIPTVDLIDDTTTASNKTWSSQKIDSDKADKSATMRYNVTSGKPEYWDGTQWVEIALGGSGMTPNFSAPLTITSGTAVTKDCIAYVNPNPPTGNTQSRDSVWFKVNDNNVYVSINVLNAQYAYVEATSGGTIAVPLQAGDVPTWSNCNVNGFEAL